MLDKVDFTVIGYALNVVGLFFLASAIAFKKPRRQIEELLGIERGWRGLLGDAFVPLATQDVQGILREGGTILGSARWAYEWVTGVLLRAAGYRRRAVLVGSGRHIEDVAHALTDEVHAPVEMVACPAHVTVVR